MTRRPRLYVFGWPGTLGGASTKLAHLLRLLHRRFPIVVVPNDDSELDDPETRPFLSGLEIQTCAFSALPQRLDGWGLSLCNFEFLLSPRWAEVRARGLKMAWSNEMMWTVPGELGSVFTGVVDQVMYVSAVQRAVLEPQFRRVWTGSLVDDRGAQDLEAMSGEIMPRGGTRGLRWCVTGNYIDPALFPPKVIRQRTSAAPIVVGRLSRPDPAKYPPDFPAFYEGLGLRNGRFRIMAWSEDLGAQWKGHHFDSRWELLPAMKEEPGQFLRSLDLFVYSLRSDLRESWGRSVVEAMLSGVVPILPDSPDHHLRNLVKHGQSGFLCGNPGEFGEFARMLEDDPALLAQCSQNARSDAVNRLCVAGEHIKQWERAFPDL